MQPLLDAAKIIPMSQSEHSVAALKGDTEVLDAAEAKNTASGTGFVLHAGDVGAPTLRKHTKCGD